MPQTKTPRVPRTKPKVYPYSIRRALTGDMESMLKDKRNQPARVAYGDMGVIAMAASWGTNKDQEYGRKILAARSKQNRTKKKSK